MAVGGGGGGLGRPRGAVDRLAALPGVSVENRWVPEGEVAALVAWADAVVLPYREASQSGVAAAAIAARRWVVATCVGGLVEQFEGEPMAILCRPEAADLRRALRQLLLDPPAVAAGLEPRRNWLPVAEDLLEGIRREVLRWPPPIVREAPGTPDHRLDRLTLSPVEADAPVGS